VYLGNWQLLLPAALGPASSPPSVSRLSRQCGILNISQPRPGTFFLLYLDNWTNLNCDHHASLPSVCLSVCVSLLVNGFVWTHSHRKEWNQQYRNCWTRLFCAVRLVSKGNQCFYVSSYRWDRISRIKCSRGNENIIGGVVLYAVRVVLRVSRHFTTRGNIQVCSYRVLLRFIDTSNFG
jgi:hypothetical protein